MSIVVDNPTTREWATFQGSRNLAHVSNAMASLNRVARPVRLGGFPLITSTWIDAEGSFEVAGAAWQGYTLQQSGRVTDRYNWRQMPYGIGFPIGAEPPKTPEPVGTDIWDGAVSAYEEAWRLHNRAVDNNLYDDTIFTVPDYSAAVFHFVGPRYVAYWFHPAYPLYNNEGVIYRLTSTETSFRTRNGSQLPPANHLNVITIPLRRVGSWTPADRFINDLGRYVSWPLGPVPVMGVEPIDLVNAYYQAFGSPRETQWRMRDVNNPRNQKEARWHESFNVWRPNFQGNSMPDNGWSILDRRIEVDGVTRSVRGQAEIMLKEVEPRFELVTTSTPTSQPWQGWLGNISQEITNRLP